MNLSIVELPRKITRQIIDHACKNPGVEVCGLISAINNKAHACYPIPNIADTPQARFEMSPTEQIRAMKSMRKSNETLFAIYHSHPDAPAFPSAADIEECAYTEVFHLIVSLEIPGTPQLNAFKIDTKGKITQFSLSVV